MGSGEGQCPLPRKYFCFVISKLHILVNSVVLNLKYVIILEDILTDVPPNQNIGGGGVPGIPGCVDASARLQWDDLTTYSVSQKRIPLRFSDIFCQTVGNF